MNVNVNGSPGLFYRYGSMVRRRASCTAAAFGGAPMDGDDAKAFEFSPFTLVFKDSEVEKLFVQEQLMAQGIGTMGCCLFAVISIALRWNVEQITWQMRLTL